MLSTQQNRLDPSEIDRETLDRLNAAFSQGENVALIDSEGKRTEIPDPIYRHIIRIFRMMREGRAVVMMPEDETFTTQAAANFLGVSRQYFVNLLESGKISFHRVGVHRRVYFKDLLEYQKQRDSARSQSLDELSNTIDQAGLYFPSSKKN